MNILKKLAMIMLSMALFASMNASMGRAGSGAAMNNSARSCAGCMTGIATQCSKMWLWLQSNFGHSSCNKSKIFEAVPDYDEAELDFYLDPSNPSKRKIDQLIDLAWQMKLMIAEATRPCGQSDSYRAPMVVALIEKMIDVVIQNVHGSKKPHQLTDKDCENLGKFLKNQQVNLTKKDREGRTPWSVVQFMLEAIAKTDERWLSTSKLEKILRVAGADPDQKNEKEKEPCREAARQAAMSDAELQEVIKSTQHLE